MSKGDHCHYFGHDFDLVEFFIFNVFSSIEIIILYDILVVLVLACGNYSRCS